MEKIVKVVNTTRKLALVLATLVAVLPPAGYFFFGYQYQSAVITTEAETNAALVSQIINESPEYWRYENHRLEEILSGYHILKHGEAWRIIDTADAVIAQNKRKKGSLSITRSHDLFDSGNVAGRIEVSRSMRPLAVNTLGVGFFSLLLGLSVYVTLKVFPLSALSTALQSLYNEKVRAREREEEIRRLNEGLEMKVEERTKQLRDAQEELVRKEKLSIIGQLAGTVGHELRNPLGVINNAVYFLNTVMSDADETVREYLGIIKNEVDNSLRIITDLLDFSRTRTPQARPVTALELIRLSLEKCAVPDNVKLDMEIPEGLPLVKVDPFQMGQVFQNLITNAAQAMPEGGALKITVQKSKSAKEQKCNSTEVQKSNSAEEQKSKSGDGDFIEISVFDTGMGISTENMEKLFQPLFTTKAKGIGLGLVVCKRLTEANGGEINVKSKLSEGTTFTILLPVERG